MSHDQIFPLMATIIGAAGAGYCFGRIHERLRAMPGSKGWLAAREARSKQPSTPPAPLKAFFGGARARIRG